MGRPRSAHRQAVAVLVAEGHDDLTIAAMLGLPSAEAVRSLRRRAGVTRPKLTPWREWIAALHAEGRSCAEIAAVTGWKIATVHKRLCRLKLRASLRTCATTDGEDRDHPVEVNGSSTSTTATA